MHSNIELIEIILITYNHEPYVLQALKSIEDQEINLPIVVKVFDDHSTDKTLTLIDNFSKTSRLNIQVFPAERNYGVHANYLRAFSNIESAYVAVIEGDDFWLDSHHLKTNINNLKRFPSITLSFSSLILKIEKTHSFTEKTYPSGTFFSASDLAVDNFIGNFSCCVYRGEAIKKALETFKKHYGYDWLFHLLISESSLFMRSAHSHTVYRIHNNGAWSRLNEDKKIEETIKALNEYNAITQYRFSDNFNKNMNNLNLNLTISKLTNSSMFGGYLRVLKQILPSRIKSYIKTILIKIQRIK